MRVLVVTEPSEDPNRDIIEPNVVFFSGAEVEGELERVLIDGQFDALVAAREVAGAGLERWTRSRPDGVRVVGRSAGIDGIEGLERLAPLVPGDGRSSTVEAMRALEQATTNSNFRRHRVSGGLAADAEEVLLVGAGITNLIAAHKLLRQGFRVRMIDSGPGPRGGGHWLSAGCTHGGDDARMFTLSEMDNYNCRHIHDDMNTLFRRRVGEGGWALYRDGSLTADELRWIEEFETISPWRAEVYTADIFRFTEESHRYWQRWIRDDPELFDASGYCPRILRIYSDERALERDVERHRMIGSTQAVLSPTELAAKHPTLATAVRDGNIVGGQVVVGFTVNVNAFSRLLLQRLEAAGAQVTWECPAEEIVFDAGSSPRGVRVSGAEIEVANLVISPGAYGGRLLEPTRSRGGLHGVLGVWMRLPNLRSSLDHSLKLKRTRHIVDDANVTLGTDAHDRSILILGSGYGHVGTNPGNIEAELLEKMYAGLRDTAANYFPEAVASLGDVSKACAQMKYCVRPWTSTGLGLLEILQSSQGGRCVVTGGHNTGGFAQAPAVAEAIAAALGGIEHPMHQAYDPGRAVAFVSG